MLDVSYVLQAIVTSVTGFFFGAYTALGLRHSTRDRK